MNTECRNGVQCLRCGRDIYKETDHKWLYANNKGDLTQCVRTCERCKKDEQFQHIWKDGCSSGKKCQNC